MILTRHGQERGSPALHMKKTSREHAKAALSTGLFLVLGSWSAMVAGSKTELHQRGIKIIDDTYSELAHLGINIDLEVLKAKLEATIDLKELTIVLTRLKSKLTNMIEVACGDYPANWFNFAFIVAILCATNDRQTVYQFREQIKTLATLTGYPLDSASEIIERIAHNVSIVEIAETVHRVASQVIDIPRIFISYAHEDSEMALQIVDGLCNSNIALYVDQIGNRPGDEWLKRLSDELRQTDTFMPILTRNSIQNHWVMLELGAAWILDKSILPMIHDVDIEGLPEPVKSIQGYHLTRDHRDKTFLEALVKRLHSE
jgi:hypothetical protein